MKSSIKINPQFKNSILPTSFYTRSSVVDISRDLIGKYLYTQVEGDWTGGIIVETEAYCGASDQACHAFPNKRTKRTETMYQKGGIAYVYLCYGIHAMFNVVTNVDGKADAVLIRAIEPTLGIPVMMQRRNLSKIQPRLTAGPGCLTKALGINCEQDRNPLQGPVFWLSNRCIETGTESKMPEELLAGPRIGIDYAGEDALLPWRFWLKGNQWVSKR